MVIRIIRVVSTHNGPPVGRAPDASPEGIRTFTFCIRPLIFASSCGKVGSRLHHAESFQCSLGMIQAVALRPRWRHLALPDI